MSLKEIGPDSILEFWFGTSRGDPEALAARNAIWFTADAAFDQKVRDRFSAHLEQAACGEYKLWELTPRGTLALIIIFDQFPRNIYRSTPQAFTYDERALALCRDGVAMGIDRELDVIERTFFYLPLEHAEDLNAQDKSLVCFEKLDADAPAPLKAITADYLQYAASHREIVRRFGRFPHRNLVLGRTSTPAEIEWIASDSKTLGQG